MSSGLLGSQDTHFVEAYGNPAGQKGDGMGFSGPELLMVCPFRDFGGTGKADGNSRVVAGRESQGGAGAGVAEEVDSLMG